jgi:hypothetical protein
MNKLVWKQNPHTTNLRIEGFSGEIEIYSLTLVNHPYLYEDENGNRHQGIRALSGLFHKNIIPTQDFYFALTEKTRDWYTEESIDWNTRFFKNQHTPREFHVTKDQEELIVIAKIWCEKQFNDFLQKLDIERSSND